MPLTITSQNRVNVGAGTTTGLMAFYGETPVDQAAAITHVGTTAVTTTTPFGFGTSTQATAIITAVNSMLTALEEIGVIAT
jgi:hypothetical protein